MEAVVCAQGSVQNSFSSALRQARHAFISPGEDFIGKSMPRDGWMCVVSSVDMDQASLTILGGMGIPPLGYIFKICMYIYIYININIYICVHIYIYVYIYI